MNSNFDEHRQKELRYYYGIIYSWHKDNGYDQYAKRFTDSHRNLQLKDRYIQFLENMIPPEEAEANHIGEAALQLLTGCMEWSYSKVYKNEIPLNVAASKIKTILEEIKRDGQDHENIESLRTIENVSSSKIVEPHFIEFEIPTDEYSDKYQSYARIAYADVLHMDESIGGFIVLSETNLEKENTRSQIHANESSKRKIRFRNSARLNLTENKEPNSIVEKVKNNEITILSIKLGD